MIGKYTVIFIKFNKWVGESMANDKVSKFIDVYADELGLDEEIRGYLKELIPNLAKKYQGTNIDIRQDNLQTYIIDPSSEDYSLEEFFINRFG